ncbi:RHS repeat-associated core domain-containing protein [Nocardiopsis exhalans]|uniref:RHS repeat-associated core domain-containing protein n=1 Tax=Nocardiopsis exhalans TaxID=163604 RepID=A0ABY5D8C2_9ACTN|nr:RHS repeat-associated core domain-containing protein [Nocardiopsis exhalans]USY19361.1 RHS repeat-associated core domain-containing protein [Nocardiopsis exhalans]
MRPGNRSDAVHPYLYTPNETGSTGNSVHSYDYDQAGNMVSRNSGEHDQSLEWGPEGELTKVTGGLSTTEYVYDADGERLLRRTNGATTLYLPGMEVTWDPAEGTEEATRYFTHAGETVAVRENDGRLHWITSDHHGTGEMTIAAIGDEVVQRRMTVFGQDRGTTGTWPGERGFVDGMIDASTGLTQLGARAYEADLGRFISVDPLMDLVDAQSMNGYAYANNSPATYWDGSGLSACIPAEGACMEVGGNTTVYSRESTYGGGSNLTKRTYNFAYFSRPISTSHTYIDGSTNQTFRWSSSSPAWSATTTPTTFIPYTLPASYVPPPVKTREEKWLEEANWFEKRYSRYDGQFQGGNLVDDAAMVLVVIGIFACPACAVAAVVLSVTKGYGSFGTGGPVSGARDLAGALVPGGTGRLLAQGAKISAFENHRGRVSEISDDVTKTARQKKRARQGSASERHSDFRRADAIGGQLERATGMVLSANSAGVAVADPTGSNGTWHRY